MKYYELSKLDLNKSAHTKSKVKKSKIQFMKLFMLKKNKASSLLKVEHSYFKPPNIHLLKIYPSSVS